GYALAGGLLTTVTAMGGYALAMVQARTFDEAHAVLAVLIGWMAASTAGLAWLTARQRIGAGVMLALQAWLGLLGMVGLAVVLLPRLLSGPGLPPEGWYAV